MYTGIINVTETTVGFDGQFDKQVASTRSNDTCPILINFSRLS